MSNLRQLKVTFDSLDNLVAGIEPGLSRTRLVVPLIALRAQDRTDDAVAEGTRVRLEIGTARKGALIRGVAKVADAPEKIGEDGLHLHVIHLDPSSTRLVDSIVRGEIAADEVPAASGHSPFDIPAADPAPEVDKVVAESEERSPDSALRRRRVWPLAWARSVLRWVGESLRKE